MDFSMHRLIACMCSLSAFFSCQAPQGFAESTQIPHGALSIHVPTVDALQWERTTKPNDDQIESEASAAGFGIQYEKILSNGMSAYLSIDNKSYSIQHEDAPGRLDGWEYRLGSRIRIAEKNSGWQQFFIGGHALLGSGLTQIINDAETGQTTGGYWGIGGEIGAHWFISPAISIETTLMYEHHLDNSSYITSGSINQIEEHLNGLSAQIGLAIYY